MGAISMNLPAIFMPAGPMLRGNWNGQRSGQRLRRLEILGRAARRQHHRGRLAGDRERHRALAGPLHDDGHRVDDDERRRGAGPHAAGRGVDSRRRFAPCAAWRRSPGQRIVEMVWEDLKPSRHPRPPSRFDNAVTTVLALGGSTNAIVHLIAHGAPRRRRRSTLDRFDELARSTPLLANMRPAGKYLMEDFFYAGGLRALLAELGDLLDGTADDRQRPTLGENIAGAQDLQRRRDPPARQSARRQRRPRRAARQSRARRRGDQAAPRWRRIC